MADPAPLSAKELKALAKFDTPTICNALEVVAPERRLHGYNIEPLVCPYPHLPPIVGYARTSTIRSCEPSFRGKDADKKSRLDWYRYVDKGGPKPAIVVQQDIDGDRAGYGSFWGEVNTNIHKGLGCLGVITNGSIRDIPMNAKNFQMLAGMVNPSHAWIHTVEIGVPVTVCGMSVKSGDLVHADMHGAVVIPHAVAGKIAAAADLIAKRERVLISAAQKKGFDFDKLAKAIADADEIH
jgi:regulator of RNase E activity RraA